MNISPYYLLWAIKKLERFAELKRKEPIIRKQLFDFFPQSATQVSIQILYIFLLEQTTKIFYCSSPSESMVVYVHNCKLCDTNAHLAQIWSFVWVLMWYSMLLHQTNRIEICYFTEPRLKSRSLSFYLSRQHKAYYVWWRECSNSGFKDFQVFGWRRDSDWRNVVMMKQ